MKDEPASPSGEDGLNDLLNSWGNVAALIPEWMAVLAILSFLGIKRVLSVLNKQAAGGKRVKRRAIRNAPKTELAISAGGRKGKPRA